MSDSELRLEALEKRLAAVEERLKTGNERPLPTPPRDLKRLEPWLLRLHESVGDLATDQSDLHAQLGRILDHLEGATDPGTWAPAPKSAFGAERSTGGAARQGLRALVGVARRARSLVRRFRQSSAPGDWVHRDPRPIPPKRLTLAVISKGPIPPDWQGLAAESYESEAFEPTNGLPPESQADVWLRLDGPHGAGIALAALDLMAIEDLSFLHVRLPTGSTLLFVRREWWHPYGLSPEKLAKAPRGRVLGKSVGLGGAPRPSLPAAAAEKIRLFKGRWLAAKGPKKPIPHARFFGLENTDEKRVDLAVIFTRPIGGGLDRVLSELIGLDSAGPDSPSPDSSGPHSAKRGAGSVLVAQLASEGFSPAHPVASTLFSSPDRRLSFPLSDLYDEEDRPLALRVILARHRPRRLLHIGPGIGLFNVEEMLESLSAFDEFEHLEVADPRFPDQVLEAPPQARPLTLASWAGEPPSPLPDQEATRRRLGLAIEATVAVHLGDLGFDERPEDVLAAVATLPDDQRPVLLFAGRGPLASTLDDLVRFYGLNDVLRLDIEPMQAIAACDFLVSSAEVLPAPWPITLAMKQGRPWIGLESASFEEAIAETGLRAAAGDVKGLAALVAKLTQDADERRRLGQRAALAHRRLVDA